MTMKSAPTRSKTIFNARRQQQLGFSLMTLISVLTVIPIVVVVIYILIQGLPAFSWTFLTAMPSDGMRKGGILPAIIGTFYLTLGTAIFSVPLGIAAAIYLAEYAQENRWTRLIRITIINLAGIPSVVYGLFGLGLFVIFLRFGTSILAASLTLSIMTLPVIISTTEEALRSVPNSFRVVSISLGASRWQTIWKIILPEALPGILTGVILRRWRNGADPLHRRGFLLTTPACLSVGCHYGLTLPSLRYFHPGARNANPYSIWHGAGFTGLCAGNEPDCDRHSFASACSPAVVKAHG
jgi:phosphate ABC transporter permease subunit PstA